MHVYPEDAGTYTLKATNNLGQAVNSADLNVKSKETIVKDTLHSAAMKQISHLEQQQVSQVLSKLPLWLRCAITIYSVFSVF